MRISYWSSDVCSSDLHFLDVPGNRLALAVRVGREDQRLGLLRLVGDGAQLLGLVGIGFPFHRETGVWIDRAVLGGKIADVTIGCEDAIFAAQIFFDGLCLGRDRKSTRLNSSH